MSELLNQQQEYSIELADVDHFNRLRELDGTHHPEVLQHMHQNKITGVKEAGITQAISTVYHPHDGHQYRWIDQTPIQVAESGYRFHRHPAALERVAIEVDEARDVTEHLTPGYIKVFISPKMSRADASYKEAEAEHLADDDMLRIHMIDVDDAGAIKGKYMESLLVRHIPLSAWVSMLQDPHNIFGKSMPLEDTESALSVMKLHHELELPEAALPEGVVSLVEAVIPYVTGEDKLKVEQQLALFRDDQQTLHKKAERIADRWLSFDVALADSLHNGYAVPEVETFMRDLAFEWNDQMAEEILDNTMWDGRIRMTRSLAAKLEVSRQNTLWVSAAVITGNEAVLAQLSPGARQQIHDTEMFVQTMMQNGASAADIQQVESGNSKTIASENVTAGGGCPGKGKGSFSDKSAKKNQTGESGQSCPEVKNGQTVKCPGCKERVKAIVPNKETIFCSNASCKLAAPHLKSQKIQARGIKDFIKPIKSVETAKPQVVGKQVGELAMAGV